MPSWGNTDSLSDKPHFPFERQVRPFATFTTANTTSGGNTIVFTGVNSATAANIGVVSGMFVYGANVASTGEQEFFVSNNTVRSVSGNTITLSNNVFGTIASGATIDIGVAIQYNSNTANTYFSDTVLVSPTRMANTVGFANTETCGTGWVKVTTGIGGRAGRVQTEVLVALANTATANVLSGNTSNSQVYYAGL